MRTRIAVALVAFTLALPSLAAAQDAGGSIPTFKEGDVITYDQIEKILNER